MIRTLLSDLKFAVRSLVKRPGFTLVTTLVLAIGTGAVTVMFSTLDTVVLRPLPFDRPDQLVWLWGSSQASPRNSLSALDYFDYREQFGRFKSLAAYLIFRPTIILKGDKEPEPIPFTLVSYNFFSTLGVQPEVGRAFRRDEEAAGGPRVVIVSHGFWQRRLGGGSGAVGSVLTLDGQPFEVVGVMPASFEFPEDVELWLPMQHDQPFTSGRGNNNFRILGRLQDGATLAQAQAEATVLARQIEEAYPDSKTGWGLLLEPMHEALFGQYRAAMLMLMGAVVLLLLITCANVSSLFLARAFGRQGELALRFSLGASRWRVVSQLLTESLVVALVGGGAGLLLAVAGMRAIQVLGPSDLPRLDEIGIDRTVVIFTTLVSVAAGLLFGLVPALRGTRLDLVQNLKEGGRTTEGQGGLTLRSVLVVAQVSLSLMLLIGSGLLIRSFIRLQDVDPGLRPDHLLLSQVQLPAYEFDTEEKQVLFLDQMRQRFKAIPGVVDVGVAEQLPMLARGMWNSVYPGDRPPPPLDQQTGATRRRVSEGTFETLGIPILAGRSFQSTDRPGSPSVMIINKTLADLFWPDGDALGKTVVAWDSRMEVVGIASDLREFGPASAFRPVFYLPLAQWPTSRLELALRTQGDPLAVTGLIRSTLAELNPNVPVSNFHTMESRLSDRVAQPRFRTYLLLVFAVIALIMAATGLYGVLAYFVSQRTHELGIRIALGADAGNVILLVVRKGMALAGLGIVVGLAGGLVGTRLMQSLLYETAPTDVMTFAAVIICLMVVTLLACLVPALRAVRVDPLVALRTE